MTTRVVVMVEIHRKDDKMKKILSHTGNEVYIGHFQGNTIKKYLDIVEECSLRNVIINPKIQVITVFTDPSKALTALQLERSQMPYLNAYKETDKEFSNVDKILYYVDALKKTTSEYSLLVDGYDVLFMRNLDEGFIEEFKKFKVDILFNATKNNYPNFTIDDVKERNQLGEFQYLNAGVVFGKTSDLLSFYEEALLNTKNDEIINPWNSEQLYIRYTANGKKNLSFDSNCVLFQTFSRTSVTTIGETLIIV